MGRYEPGELAALREVAADEETLSTRLCPEALDWLAQLYRPTLASAASAGETLTYGELANGFPEGGYDLGNVLGLIGLTEDRLGRPLLPAVVVREDCERPREAYFSLVEEASGPSALVPPPSATEARRELWERHRRAVWAHDW